MVYLQKEFLMTGNNHRQIGQILRSIEKLQEKVKQQTHWQSGAQ